MRGYILNSPHDRDVIESVTIFYGVWHSPRTGTTGDRTLQGYRVDTETFHFSCNPFGPLTQHAGDTIGAQLAPFLTSNPSAEYKKSRSTLDVGTLLYTVDKFNQLPVR